MRFSRPLSYFLPLLGLAIPSTSAQTIDQDLQTALYTCLTTKEVPVSLPDTEQWTLDTTPFNTRLPYQPLAIAVPTTVEHVQDAITCALAVGPPGTVKVTAKSGGHSYAALGLGGRDGHLVVVLDRMDAVVVSSSSSSSSSDDDRSGEVTARIEPGARLGRVAIRLFEEAGRAISHGTCPGVGIGGHALHGGYGMSSYTHGLALDWITGMTVVLANATVVHCSESENPDLFWALRGAGASFGIVTEFKVTTFAPPEVLTVFNADLLWDTTEDAGKGIAGLQEFAASGELPRELTMRAVFSGLGSSVEGVFYGGEDELTEVLGPLLERVGGEWGDRTEGGWMDMLVAYAYGTELDQGHPYNMTETFYATSITTPALSPSQISSFVHYWYNTAPTGFANSRYWWVQMDLVGGPNSAVQAVPGDATSHAHRDKLLLFQLYDRVFGREYPSADDEEPTDDTIDDSEADPKTADDPTDDAAADDEAGTGEDEGEEDEEEGGPSIAGFNLLQGFVRSVTTGMERGEWGMYANYADTELNSVLAQEVYWGVNLERLKAVKRVVDPMEVFWNPLGVTGV